MSYLTRIRLNPNRSHARKLLARPAAMKAAVYATMPRQPVPDDERILWRLDSDNRHQPLLWVLSDQYPSPESIIEQAGWPSADHPQAETRDYTPLLARLAAGDRYAFRLTANPTYLRTVVRDDGRSKKLRSPHRTVAHQTRWLTDRQHALGLHIDHTAVPVADGDPPLDLAVAAVTHRRFDRGTSKVTLLQVTYQGHATVSDPDRLRSALTRGVGRAKAYGCGLLTLAPAATTQTEAA